MARKPYLEFSVEDRRACSKVFNFGARNGWFDKPSKADGCSACGQTKGPVELHREDYSEYEPNSSLVVICYRCHRVLHMRDRYPEGWEFYRNKIREGYQYPWAKDIGPVASDMRGKVVRGAKIYPERDRTVLDDIHDGLLLRGTRAERKKKLEEIHKMYAEISSGGQQALFKG